VTGRRRVETGTPHLYDSPPKGLAMERMKALSRGTKLVLASSFLLFFDLFFTWQKLPLDFGRAGRAVASLDGWDAWGLLIGLLTMALVALVVIVHLTDLELSPDVLWGLITLGLATAVFVLTVVKNLTDAESALASYVGIVLAALAVVGAYMARAETRPEAAAEAMRPQTTRPAPRAYEAPKQPERTPVETAGRKW